MTIKQSFTIEMALFFCLIYFLLSTTSAFVCDFTDCQALLKFKTGITGDPEGHLQAWNESNPFCNWTGITCHQNLQNRAIALELIDMDLDGSISPFLSNLSFLTRLSLHGNNFHGEIPTSLGMLSQLTHLNVSDNVLEGSIPASVHGCQSLEVLELTKNTFSGVIPEELGWLKKLTVFALSKNNLTGSIPAFFSNMTELRELRLAFNYFTGKIPMELGALTKLEILYLHRNFLEGAIPASISNCTALREISVGDNLITGEIPSEIGNKIQNLQKLYFLSNYISGRIPVTLSNLSQLTLLDLSLNNLEGGVPAELGELKNLEFLSLHSNFLVSDSSLSFLTALTNCSFLQKLHLAFCLFAGSLPASIGDLSKDLYYFSLFKNNITGKVPDSIGNLSGLVSLNLGYNYLNGTIPGSFGKLGHLQRLHFGRNKLQGSIPDEMAQTKNLGFLNLSDNCINGSIPSSLSNLSQLRYLYLSHNNLSGPIPTELTQCSVMMLLDLSSNNLHGSLPPEIGLLSELGLSLNFSNNNLNGEIPASIGKLASVQEIDLSKNRFSGIIPSFVGSCISLNYLNLSNNMLEGEVPNMERFKNLSISSLIGNTGLCGGSGLKGLHPCKVQKKTRQSRKWKKAAGADEPNLKASPSHHFTQRELEMATLGFSETNLLGRGSFGSVYKAQIDDGKSIVAVKVLGGEYRQSYKSFKREWEILSEYLHEGCFVQVVHCDLKPQNVLLDNDMVAHVADFGIGKLMLVDKPQGYSTMSSFLRGSVGYIPPEYGQGAEISVKGDVYSFGVMLLELITRQRPTGEIFRDGLDLRKWVVAATPHHILDVVDMSLKLEAHSHGSLEKLEQCCDHVVDAGMMCTEENPQSRPSMSVITRELQNVWKQMEFGE
ncbi:unnamed protein product [Dovyalis caffra]|uniref:non-specific serine/threonine protein kinase n=1 Tax=Dovyalis caffra TaxID=77055 RepID=A0AAV1RYM3_9ROSI|nr:unnamed protein product [Dovyalis caffra]